MARYHGKDWFFTFHTRDEKELDVIRSTETLAMSSWEKRERQISSLYTDTSNSRRRWNGLTCLGWKTSSGPLSNRLKYHSKRPWKIARRPEIGLKPETWIYRRGTVRINCAIELENARECFFLNKWQNSPSSVLISNLCGMSVCNIQSMWLIMTNDDRRQEV